MLFKKIILLALLAGFLMINPGCSDNDHDDMHGRMGDGNHMGSGRMMNDRPGMMNDSAYQGRQGMMGQGQMQSNTGSQPGSQQMLNMDEARQHAERYLEMTGNTDLILGEGMDSGNEYEFPLRSKQTNQKKASLIVDKTTGEVHSRQ